MEYPGAIYHVINRGDRQEPIFRNDEDRRLFLRTLIRGVQPDGLAGACLRAHAQSFSSGDRNPGANLVAGMKWFLGTYTNRFNRRHKLFGHLFSGRYKSLIVDGSGNGYLKTVCDYVHLNPARAKLVEPRSRCSRSRGAAGRNI